MTPVKPPGFITPCDYLAGEEISDTKHEYIGGTVHAMAGATNRHNSIAASALLELSPAFTGKQRVRLLQRRSCRH